MDEPPALPRPESLPAPVPARPAPSPIPRTPIRRGLAAAFLLAWLGAGTARAGATDLAAHDPSRITPHAGRYWVFSTGRGCRTASSTNLTEWVPGPRVFRSPLSWWTTVVPGHNGDVWAPDVLQFNGRFHLYYSISIFGKNTSAIGLATNPTLDPAAPGFAWKDEGVVVQTAASDAYNAIDPAPFRESGGRLWLAFGSYWSGIQLLELDPATGKRLVPEAPLRRLAHHDSIEAACLHQHDDWYYLFVNWGTCCRGLDSTYHLRVGRSREVTGPYLDCDGVDLAAGGGTLFRASTGRFIGPGHAAILVEGETHWLSTHFYDAEAGGRAKLDVRPLRWTPAGWPALE